MEEKTEKTKKTLPTVPSSRQGKTGELTSTRDTAVTPCPISLEGRAYLVVPYPRRDPGKRGGEKADST
jgi:hypothetical protein